MIIQQNSYDVNGRKIDDSSEFTKKNTFPETFLKEAQLEINELNTKTIEQILELIELLHQIQSQKALKHKIINKLISKISNKIQIYTKSESNMKFEFQSDSEYLIKQLQQLECFKIYIISQLEDVFSKKIDLKNFQIVEEFQFQMPKKLESAKQQDSIQNKNKHDVKKYSYQMLLKSTSQVEQCRAIAIHKIGVIIVGCFEIIKVFSFKENKELKLNQLLVGHSKDVTNLQFFCKGRNFVSVGDDGLIIIWQNNLTFGWQNIQIVYQQVQSIYSLVVNETDDYIVLSNSFHQYTTEFFVWGRDENKKFWKYYNFSGFVSKCQIFNAQINRLNNVYVATTSKGLIIFRFKLKLDCFSKQYELEDIGSQICFISDYNFAFQSFIGKQLDIYSYDFVHDKLSLIRKIVINNFEQCLFKYPLKFIQSKNIFVSRSNKCLNIIDSEGNSYQSHYVTRELQIANFSNNGKYYVNWDHVTKEIQLYKLYKIC